MKFTSLLLLFHFLLPAFSSRLTRAAEGDGGAAAAAAVVVQDEVLTTSLADAVAARDETRFLALLARLREAEKPKTVEETVDRLRRLLADAVAARDETRFLALLARLREAEKPKTVEETVDRLRRLSTTNPMDDIVARISHGLFSGSLQGLLADVVGLTSGVNSQDNSNPDPPRPLYPAVGSCDAPYSVPEDRLRAAIYIPPGFTNGRKPPVILVPNTGNTGYTTYMSSLIPLLTAPATSYADPVWLNLPAFSTGDIQVYAEYVAYAIHYVASRAGGRKVTVVGLGQASVTNHWALKYWPSTRNVTAGEFAVSGDYHGSVAALPSSVVLSGIGNVPALIQQWNQSQFIRALRSHGGGSAYVPTTSVFTGFQDALVQPQTGPGASAVVDDERRVGVTNAEVQVVCRGRAAGGFYNFASVLLHPLVHALLEDVVANGGRGPGRLARLDLARVCGSYLAPGLGLNDLLASQKYLLVDLVSIAMSPNKTLTEPIYPSVSHCDAPYSVPEQDLRSAIYMPPTFTNGTKAPVILVPIAGNTVYGTYGGNIVSQLAASDYADPVWVNVPGWSMGDMQVNAEYVAYAMHYVASRTGRNVTMMGLGRGSLTSAWALKYWPSTRKITSNDFAVTGVYNGTTAALHRALVAAIHGAVPALTQLDAGSSFIRTFRAHSGDSAYVPTTSVYSSFYDELVQPQSGTAASAIRGDARGVGVANVEVQAVCRGHPAGSFYDGSGLSVNPVVYALLRDAITNGGPGQLSRIDLAEVCSSYLAPGMGLDALLSTQNYLISAIVRLVPHIHKSLVEPAIKSYATANPDACVH
ncbi:hypothetical protein L249_7697 [Ophiocordyceps polyrhachis-furcata BCC 54312]|uniref:Lipase n=1 Tax=Ophiocordyceps polyrhachis-furcata BCC 54312 TaxID=1330021 RepID=A0A367LAQ3_9HYPO|nr:hypothetical protein L249_7697 [Ophiocordyceps polyrhachis-furcata BCC 54312]